MKATQANSIAPKLISIIYTPRTILRRVGIVPTQRVAFSERGELYISAKGRVACSCNWSVARA